MHKGTGRPTIPHHADVTSQCIMRSLRCPRWQRSRHTASHMQLGGTAALELLQLCEHDEDRRLQASPRTYIDTRECECCGYMGWGLGWTGRLTCDAKTTAEHSAVARAAIQSTISLCCNALGGLRQRCHLVLPLILERLRACRRRIDCSVQCSA